MLREFATIRSDQTLGEALDALVELQADPNRANAVAVVGAAGEFEGVVTAPLLCKSLLALWMPARSVREDAAGLHRQLVELVADRTGLSVHDTLIHGLSTVSPASRLLELIEASCEQRLEFIPVVEDGRLLGLVPVTAVFQAVAALALTPEHEGIHIDERAKDGGAL